MSCIPTVLALLLLFTLSAAPAGCAVEVVSGPVVLHDCLRQQWGGHTFGYLLEGTRALFWSGAAYDPNEKGGQTHMLVGQYPKPGSELKSAVTAVPIPTAPFPSQQQNGQDAGWQVYNCNQPQMVRTPDGYIHIFVGCGYHTDDPKVAPGRIRYYRSAKPEDVTTLVDRTELIPTTPYDCFHLRMNVGVGPDGRRIALVVLAYSPIDEFGFNTPVVFVGQRSGLDFTFSKPAKYAEPMGFFYPQVAATNAGIVVTGQVWEDAKHSGARLMHLNWDGRLMHREELPMTVEGSRWPIDLRPLDPAMNRLGIYVSRVPRGQSATCSHEFWSYDAQSMRLRELKSVDCVYQKCNYAKWVKPSHDSLLFVNNPCMGGLYAWEGGTSGGRPVTNVPIRGADLQALGYKASCYLFVPNAIHGSVPAGREFYLASDCQNPAMKPGDPGPVSLLLWRMSVSD